MMCATWSLTADALRLAILVPAHAFTRPCETPLAAASRVVKRFARGQRIWIHKHTSVWRATQMRTVFMAGYASEQCPYVSLAPSPSGFLLAPKGPHHAHSHAHICSADRL